MHVHRCGICGTAWICGRVDCGYDDACVACEQSRFERFADRQGWTVNQPELPNLAEAGFTKESF